MKYTIKVTVTTAGYFNYIRQVYKIPYTCFLVGYMSGTHTFIAPLDVPISCREILVNVYVDYLDGELHKSYKDYSKVCSEFKRSPFVNPSFVIFSNRDLYTNITRIVQLLNKFEEKQRWRRTKVHTIKKSNYESCNEHIDSGNCYLFLVQFSQCWVNNPIFFYIYSSIFKLTLFNLFHKNHIRELLKSETLEDLLDKKEDMRNNKIYAKDETNIYEKYETSAYKNANLWLGLIKHRRKIFKGFTREGLYFPGWGFGVHEALSQSDSTKLRFTSDGNRVSLYERIEEYHKMMRHQKRSE